MYRTDWYFRRRGHSYPAMLHGCLAKDVVGAVPHPEIHTLEPSERELLVISDQRHGRLPLPTMDAVSVLMDGTENSRFHNHCSQMCTGNESDAAARLLPSSSELKKTSQRAKQVKAGGSAKKLQST